MNDLPQNYQMCGIAEEQRGEVIDLERWAFPSEETREEMLDAPNYYDFARTQGIRHQPDGRLVAMHSSIRWDALPVPGATAAAAGLTMVAVHPEHRRKGLLNAMIDLHFSHCRKRGEAISMLTATEAAIYGRYGYGHASDSLSLTLNRGQALRPVEGSQDVKVSILDVDPAAHAALIDRIHREAGASGMLARPGWGTRDTPNLRDVMLRDFPSSLRGTEETRLALAEREGQPVGYALFRRSDIWACWAQGAPGAEVIVKEYAALDGAATCALWSRLLDLDLTVKVHIGPLPANDPLVGMLVAVGTAQTHLEEMLWVRLVDVPAALAARRYATDVDAVLEVEDSLIAANQGRWHLSAPAFGGPVCVEPTSREPDIRLDVRELGAAYLGGTSLASLAACGLVRSTDPLTLLKVASAFLWPVSPACTWYF